MKILRIIGKCAVYSISGFVLLSLALIVMPTKWYWKVDMDAIQKRIANELGMPQSQFDYTGGTFARESVVFFRVSTSSVADKMRRVKDGPTLEDHKKMIESFADICGVEINIDEIKDVYSLALSTSTIFAYRFDSQCYLVYVSGM